MSKAQPVSQERKEKRGMSLGLKLTQPCRGLSSSFRIQAQTDELLISQKKTEENKVTGCRSGQLERLIRKLSSNSQIFCNVLKVIAGSWEKSNQNYFLSRSCLIKKKGARCAAAVPRCRWDSAQISFSRSLHSGLISSLFEGHRVLECHTESCYHAAFAHLSCSLLSDV